VSEHLSTPTHRFKRAVRAAGLSDEYTLNTLRHTFASWAVIAGVDLYRVSKWLGHASIKTTEIYARLSPEYGVSMAVPDEVAAVFGGMVAVCIGDRDYAMPLSITAPIHSG
jgi:integrase